MKSVSVPTLIYDGDCGFCKSWISRWRLATRNRANYIPYQEVALEFPEISKEDFQNAVHLIEPDQSVSSGAKAIFRLLALCQNTKLPLFLYLRFSLFAKTSEIVYRFVARNRFVFSHLTYALWGEDLTPSTFRFASRTFPKTLVPIVAAFAFYFYRATQQHEVPVTYNYSILGASILCLFRNKSFSPSLFRLLLFFQIATRSWIEFSMSFLIFMPRRPRLIAFALLIFSEVFRIYTHINSELSVLSSIYTISLGLFLLDDSTLRLQRHN